MAEYRTWVKSALFLSSYIPLWLAMALKIRNVEFNVFGHILPWLSIVFAILSVLSGYVLYEAINIRRTREPNFIPVKSYRSRHDLVTSYLIPYLFPFVNLDYGELTNWAIFAIFFIVLAAIQIRSAHLHVNPVLAIFGYQIFEIQDDGKGTHLLLARRTVDLNKDAVKAVELSKGVFLTVQATDGGQQRS